MRKTKPPTAEELRSTAELTDPLGDYSKPVEETIYEMKVAGYSVREIAAGVSKTESEVETAINIMAEAARTRMAAELSIATILEIDRMDRQLKALWPSAEAGDHGAIDRVQNISKERRRLLGIDAPQVKATLTFGTGNQVDLSKLTTEELRQWEQIQRKLTAPTTTLTVPQEKVVSSLPAKQPK